MPKIPEYQPQMSTILDKNPPGVQISPWEMGGQYQAASRLGGEMAQVGGELYQKQAQAQDANSAANQVHSDMVDFNDFQQKLKTQMPDDYQGYTQAVQGWIKDRQDQVAQGGMSARAQQLYTQQAGAYFTHQVLQAQDEQNKQQLQSHLTDVNNNIESSGSVLVNNPSEQLAYDHYHQLIQQIDGNVGTLYGEGDAQKLRAQAQGTLATGYFDGLYNKAAGNPKNGNVFARQALANLAGKTEMDQGAGEDALFKGLSVDQLAAQQLRFERLIKSNQEIGRAQVSAQVNDDLAAALNGKAANPQTLQNIRGLVASGAMPAEDGARAFYQLAGAQAVGQLSNQLRGSNPGEWDKIKGQFDTQMNATTEALQKQFPGVASIGGPNFGEASREYYRGMLDQQANRIEQFRSNYGAEAAFQASPTVANQFQAAGNDPGKVRDAIVALSSVQKSLGIPEKILTSDDEDKMVQGFKTASPQQQSAQLNFYAQKYGDNWGRVMGELSGKQKIDPHLWAAASMPDQATQVQMLTNLEKQKDITTGFKDQYGAEEGTPARDLNQAVAKKMAPYYAAMTGGSEDPGAAARPNALSNFVTLEAKRIMVNQGISNADQAASQASALVSRNFTPIQAANSNVLIPNQGNRPEIIRGLMEAALSPKGIQALNLRMPEGVNADNAPDLLGQYGRWTNPSGNTLELQLAPPGRAPLTLRGQDGNPIRFDLGDISNGKIPDSLYQMAVDQARYGSRVKRLGTRVGTL